MSVKEQVLQAIQRLPDDIDYRDITEEIAVLAKAQSADLLVEVARRRAEAQINPALLLLGEDVLREVRVEVLARPALP